MKILRELKDYTQKYVADEILGISQNTYSRLEMNPEKITAEQAQKLSKFYQVCASIFLSESLPVITFQKAEYPTSERINQITKQDETIEVRMLREELNYLRKQNDQLLRLLEERR